MRFALTVGLSAAVALAMACGDDGDNTAPTVTATVPGSTAPSDTPIDVATETPFVPTERPTLALAPGEDPQGDQLLYIALGDSLSEGIGVIDEKRQAWVPLVAMGLGDEYELLNLGVAGDDSLELIEDGPLDSALAAINERANDGIPGNEVAVITLEIGGNDLLDIYFDTVIPGDCPTVIESLQRPACVQLLEDALGLYQPNLAYTLDILQSAAPGVPIYLMTLYNPFSGGSSILDEFGVLALEGQDGTPFPEGMNDIIRAEAAGRDGVTLVDWYPLFLGKQQEYISLDLIHPNAVGHQVMADEVLGAMGR